MKNIIDDSEWKQLQKQYAELLMATNPKGTDEELAALKTRIENRRWGNEQEPFSYKTCPIWNEMYREENK
jgi:hypothetical protein